jgi:hypothetical protein
MAPPSVSPGTLASRHWVIDLFGFGGATNHRHR